MKTSFYRLGWPACAFTLWAFAAACASTQKPATDAEEVRDGEALPPAPPVPAQPASPDSTAATAPNATPAATPAPELPPAKEALSEAQVAKVTELVNTAEVEQAKLAQTRAKAPEVKRFAAMMVKHHGDALREQAKLVKKLNLKSEESVTAATLKADAASTLDTLKKADAAGFDAAYVESQIDVHRKVLDVLDTQLLPAAKTPEVADALRRARGIVEQHLTEAQALRTK